MYCVSDYLLETASLKRLRGLILTQAGKIPETLLAVVTVQVLQGLSHLHRHHTVSYSFYGLTLKWSLSYRIVAFLHMSQLVALTRELRYCIV